MKKLMELLKKKAAMGQKPMDEKEKSAKMGLLEEMEGMADKGIMGKLGKMKKVTVASDSEKGLKEGLEKAEDLLTPDEAFEKDEDELAELEKKTAEEMYPEMDLEKEDDDLMEKDVDQMSKEELEELIAKLEEMKK